MTETPGPDTAEEQRTGGVRQDGGRRDGDGRPDAGAPAGEKPPPGRGTLDIGSKGGFGGEPKRRRGRPPGRRPGQSETREAILAAARELFAEKGYDGASMRAIAREAGVDAALVHHFFGNKEGVFIAAMRFPVDPGELLPRIMSAPRDQLGETMARVFLSVWDDPESRAPILAMLRSAMTNEKAAAMMRQFVSAALFARAAELHDIPLVRVNAAVGQMLGVAILRYVLRVEPIASASPDELVGLLAPALQHYLA
ncbi:TetR/AcrR family transcriptional regulator [Actinomadura hibisca]|uniref:TetR/AcrR family transcriptional regulator n=1 Tax=Actinomadura hibisca TaxID=68565 RepID=UPI0009FCE017|nr:TetR family transcriptional regulator [Actinomadura hibisca]